jgi:hypothetical protein
MSIQSGMVGLLFLALGALMTSVPVTADELTDLVAPYLGARDDHRVGEVAGRAAGDPARPNAAEIPYEGVSVLLLPYSVAFESELDGIKEHLRDSLRTYMGAAGDVDSSRQAYESALVWAGGGELVRGEVSDARGGVRLTAVPAGEWLLLAWREEVNPGKAPKPRGRETRGFRDIAVGTGHSVVSYWWMRLQVRAGETTSVQLNDRNVWISGVKEQTFLMQGPPTNRSTSRDPARRR